MSNANRKVKPQTTDGKNLQKAKGEIAQLKQLLANANMGILNMRQLYESATQEKMAVQAQVNSLQRMLLGLVVQGRGQKVTIKGATFKKLSEFAGIDTKVDGEDLILQALTVKDVMDMQNDIDEVQEEL